MQTPTVYMQPLHNFTVYSMPSHQMLINVGSQNQPFYVHAYNKHGNEYSVSIDNQGILWVAHQDNIAYNFSHDDRLWPIYLEDRYNQNTYYPCTETAKMESGSFKIPLYFQNKDGQISIIRVKSHTMEAVYTFSVARQHLVKKKSLCYQNEFPSKRFSNAVASTNYLLPVNHAVDLHINDSNYYSKDNNNQFSEIEYKKFRRKNAVALKVAGFYRYPGTEMYPVIVRNAAGRYEQKRFEFFDNAEGNWHEKNRDNWWGAIHIPSFLNQFRNDYYFFQVDEHGILQLFHARKEEKDNFVFTGQVFDLNYTIPIEIFGS